MQKASQRKLKGRHWPAAVYDFVCFCWCCGYISFSDYLWKPEWDPVQLAGKFESKIVVSLAMIGIIISTLATNIAANIVSPANDFSNLSPKKISFRMGGYITGVIGVLIFPWKLMSDPNGIFLPG